LLLAIDQGTTGTTCLVVDDDLRPRGRGYRELGQSFPAPGLVEQDAEEIWQTVLGAADDALADAGIAAPDLTAIGIANQRETTVLWERGSGRAVAPAIVWQDRRTAHRCAALPFDLIRERTGLLPDPYFSATKLEWLLDQGGAAGELAFGTVDSWLAWKLTGEHLTDVSNASRTLLARLDTLEWDEELLALFRVPRRVLPRVVCSSGELAEATLLGARVPLTGIAGDQQAALFGQACFAPGRVKATYGTGSFVLANAGAERPKPADGVLATAAWRLDGERIVYALEGSVFVAGAAVQWLRDGLGIVADAAATEEAARSLDGNDGVYFVPALTGLGSPHWAPEARGLITGLTRGTRRQHLVRAALEAIAFQTHDVIAAMGVEPELLRADGGAAANGFLLQFQADVSRVPVEVPVEREATAIGAAALGGLGAGVWRGTTELESLWACAARYEPTLDGDEAERLLAGWHEAVRRALA
jgi:glycerol kinase